MAAIMLPFPAVLAWKLGMPASLSRPGFVSIAGPGGGKLVRAPCLTGPTQLSAGWRQNMGSRSLHSAGRLGDLQVGWPFKVQLSSLNACGLTAHLLQPPETTATEVVRWRLP